MSLAPGTRLGPYEILSLVGAGGMGEVYRALDTRLDRTVAIKILPEVLASDSQFRKRFDREARTISQLDHPHICTLYDVGEQDGTSFLVMQYLEGETLASRLEHGALPFDQALTIANQLADALDAAHAVGVIHRDVKPDNIFLTVRGAKILDFGLAKLPAQRRAVPGAVTALPTAADGRHLTSPGTALGTVAYMSPEQIRGEALDVRTDLFSLGLVLYEMTTGHQAFSGPTSGVIFEAVLNRAPTSAVRLNPALPAGLELIINKALEKDRQLRYQTAADLRADLQRLKRDTESGRAVVLSVGAPAEQPRPWWRQRTGVGMAAILTATIVAVAISLVLLWRPERSQATESLAVLPFVNGNGNSEAEYLSDGLTESLINILSRLPRLKVMSRSAAFRFKGRESDVQAASRELGVGAVVTGRIVLRGDNVSISAELVDPKDNHQLWGEHYDQKFAAILSVQDEIAKRISEKLRIQLTGEDKQRLSKQATHNPEAYQLYLKGVYHAAKFSKGELDRGLEYLRQASATDPNYALAYHGLAYYDTLVSDWLFPPATVMRSAKDAAERALRIDETLPEAHADMANYYCLYDWNWSAGEREVRRAIRLNPNYAYAHQIYGWCLIPTGRIEEAVAELRRSQQLDPLSAENSSLLGLFLYLDRRYDEAIGELQKTIELDSGYWPGHSFLGHAYARKGLLPQAVASFQKARSLEETIAEPLSGLGISYALSGKKIELHRVLDELQSRPTYVSPYNVATVYAALGNRDQAFAWLDKAYEGRSWYMTFLRVDPDLDSLRSDPRLADLLRRVGLPP